MPEKPDVLQEELLLCIDRFVEHSKLRTGGMGLRSHFWTVANAGSKVMVPNGRREMRLIVFTSAPAQSE